MKRNHETKDGIFQGNLGASVPLEIKAGSEDGSFEGYASIFGMVDKGMDTVVYGAFAESLIRTPAARVRMLWQHRPDQVIGKFSVVREDTKGLYCEGRLNLKVQKGLEAYELLKDGAIDGLSMGYTTLKDEIDRVAGIRKLLIVELWEISLVTFPMNPAATVTRVKAGTVPTKRDVEEILRDAGFSATQAKAMIANGYKALTPERDAGDGDETEALSALRTLTLQLRS